MRLFGYPYNDLVLCKDSPDYLEDHRFIVSAARSLALLGAVLCHYFIYSS